MPKQSGEMMGYSLKPQLVHSFHLHSVLLLEVLHLMLLY